MFAGLPEGDAHVIRNAGGRVSDDAAIRSLVTSCKLFGAREGFVIHHAGCGMETSTDPIMGDRLGTAGKIAERARVERRFWTWLTTADRKRSVVEDIQRIREPPLVSARIPIYASIYDTATGRLETVPEASEMVRAR